MTRDGHVDNNIIVQWIDVTLKNINLDKKLAAPPLAVNYSVMMKGNNPEITMIRYYIGPFGDVKYTCLNI